MKEVLQAQSELGLRVWVSPQAETALPVPSTCLREVVPGTKNMPGRMPLGDLCDTGYTSLPYVLS